MLLLPFALHALSEEPELENRPDRSGDLEIWNYYLLEQHLRDPWYARLQFQFRYGDGGTRLFYYDIQWDLYYQLTQWLDIGPAYRHAWRRVPSSKPEKRGLIWATEALPIFDAMIHAKGRGIIVENRHRIQWRFPLSRAIFRDWVYRIRVSVRRDPLGGKRCIAPFIDNEVFLRWGHEYVEDRLRVGLNLQRHKMIRLEVFYMLRHVRVGHVNVLGLYLFLDP